MEIKQLLPSLEERLVEHDNNRKEVQDKIQETCSKITKNADSLEEKINEELHGSFDPLEELILNLIDKLNNIKGDEEEGDDDEKGTLIKQAEDVLSSVPKYEIIHFEYTYDYYNSYKLQISKVEIESITIDRNNTESIISQLQEHLNKIQEIFTAAQNKLSEIVAERKNDAVELEKKTNEELEKHFSKEDTLIQETVSMINDKSGNDDENVNEELVIKAELTLLKNQKYSFDENKFKLIVTEEVSLKWINFEKRKPSNVISSLTDNGELSISFSFFSDDEIKVLNLINSPFNVSIKVWNKNDKEENDAKIFTKKYVIGEKTVNFVESFKPSTTYCLKVRIEHQKCFSKWGGKNVEFTTPEFEKLCTWKECPEEVDWRTKYTVDENNTRIATNINFIYCTIIGNTPIPLNKINSWRLRILKSEESNEYGNTFVGVAPSDIDQNEMHKEGEYGWYFNCLNSTLFSGPPHNYNGEEYGSNVIAEKRVNVDTIGVEIDTTKGELSFVLGGINLGIAYEGIPLDKPLVPCAIIENIGDSVEFCTFSDETDTSIPVPSNITTKSDTWDSITLTWDAVEGASFYQIEVDWVNSGDMSKTNTFTKRGLLPETEHIFKVCAVKGNSAGKWSDSVKEKTEKKSFETSRWKECPDNVNENRKYSIDEINTRIVTKSSASDSPCTIIGNTILPSNKIVSWKIKLIKSKSNDGKGIYIGVAPFDVNQNAYDNHEQCGWYFEPYNSVLFSGPPHNCNGSSYGPMKLFRKAIHAGNTMGVVMDTEKGELSLAVKNKEYGVAYEGVPLDNPLVPCVILKNEGDSVEFCFSSDDSDDSDDDDGLCLIA